MKLLPHIHWNFTQRTSTLVQLAMMHPALVTTMVVGALVELWLIFALTYAALQRYRGRNYGERVKEVMQLKL